MILICMDSYTKVITVLYIIQRPCLVFHVHQLLYLMFLCVSVPLLSSHPKLFVLPCTLAASDHEYSVHTNARLYANKFSTFKC